LAEFKTQPILFHNKGLLARVAVDQAPPDTYLNLLNIESREENALASRFGRSVITKNTTSHQNLPLYSAGLAPLPVLSMHRMVYQTSKYRYAATSRRLYRSTKIDDTSGAYTPINGHKSGVVNVDATGKIVTWVSGDTFSTAWVGMLIWITGGYYQVAHVVSATTLYLAGGPAGPLTGATYDLDEMGIYGNPTFSANFRPDMSSAPYIFFADWYQMLKDTGALASTQRWGIFAPTRPVTTQLTSPAATIIEDFDVLGDLAITGVITPAIGDKVGPGIELNPGPPPVGVLAGQISTVTPTAGSMVSIQPGALIRVDVGFAPAEDILVLSTTTLTFTAYFSNAHAGTAIIQEAEVMGGIAAGKTGTITRAVITPVIDLGQMRYPPFPSGTIASAGGDDRLHFHLQGIVSSGIVITAEAAADPAEFTSVAHGLVDGNTIEISNYTGLWLPANGVWTVTVTGPDTFTIPLDASLFGASADTPTWAIVSSSAAGAISKIEISLDVGDGSFTEDFYIKTIDNPESTMVEIQFKDFVAHGLAGEVGHTFWNVLCWRIAITAAVPCTIYLSEFYEHGGTGLDTTGGVKYDYRVTYYDNNTGAESSPSVVMATDSWLDPRRQPVLLSWVPSPDSQVTHARPYRRGGVLSSDWYKLADVPIGTNVYEDRLSDASIALNKLLEIDNDPPISSLIPVPVNRVLGGAVVAGAMASVVPGADPGVMTGIYPNQYLDVDTGDSYESVIVESTRLTGVVNTVAPATVDWVSGQTFSTTWIGKTIKINNVNYEVLGVASSIQLTLTSNPGNQSAVWYGVDCIYAYFQKAHAATAMIFASVRTGKPAALCASAYGRMWVAGDLDNPHILYYSKRNRPESFPPQNTLEIGNPSDPIMAVIEHRGVLLVATKSTWYYVSSPANAVPYYTSTGCRHGLLTYYGWTKTEADIWYKSHGGIYVFRGMDATYVSEPVEWVFRGKALGPVVPMDQTQEQSVRMAYHNNEVYCSYVGTDGYVYRLISHLIYQRGRNDQNSDTPNCVTSMFLEEDTNTLLLGMSNGMIVADRQAMDYDDGGYAVGGAAVQLPIGLNLQTPYRDQGEPEKEKLYEQVTLDLNTRGQDVTVVALFNNGEVGAITAATNATAAQMTRANHGLSTGAIVVISGFAGGWTTANTSWPVTVDGPDTFTIPLDSTAFGALAGTPVYTLTITLGIVSTLTRQQVKLDINSGLGQLARNISVRLTASVTQVVDFYGFYVKASLDTEWRLSFDTYWTDFGMLGWKFAKQGWFEYVSNATITFYVYLEGSGTPTYTFDLPSSGGLRAAFRKRLPPVEGKLWRFLALSSANFKLYPGSFIEMKPVCAADQKGYTQFPLGALSQ